MASRSPSFIAVGTWRFPGSVDRDYLPYGLWFRSTPATIADDLGRD